MTGQSTPHDATTTTIWIARAISYVIYAFIIVSEILLLQGFLLRLFGADPSAGYTQWAYNSLDRVMEPFRGIFQPVEVYGDAVLDTSILFAMVIYGIALLLMQSLISWLTYKLHKVQRNLELQNAIDAANANQPYPGVTSDGTPVIVPTTPTATTPIPPQPGGNPPAPPAY